jgi:hypothetical protein
MINQTLTSGYSKTDSSEYLLMLFTDGNPDTGIKNSLDLQSFIQTCKDNLNGNLSS